MRSVVEGLLTLARADAGEQPRARVATALGPLVAEVVELMQGLASRRGVTLDLVPPAGDVTVLAEPDRLRDAVTNLVSNAIHYNREQGRVEIAVSREGATACVRVSDTGIGIAPGDIPRIFDRFYRADKARSREAGGAGLGLAVTKWIVESHGGEIRCESEPGRGTTFTIRLPVGRPDG
jgi:signal transduction histidine kinase